MTLLKQSERLDCVPTRLSIPKSRQTIVTAPKRANSRFFTDCYPISAVFRPRVNQIAAAIRAVPRPPPDHEIHKLSFTINYLIMSLRLLTVTKQRVPAEAAGTLSTSRLKQTSIR